MQIVINIPDEAYELLKSKSQLDNIAESIIANGTPLPKGHGRLIDANELCEDRVSNDNVVIAAKCAPTIIEADKSESEE